MANFTSAPNIQSAIYKNGRITGEFTPEEVSELIITLESGKLDVALNKSPISRDFIESNLGKQLLEQGFLAIGCSPRSCLDLYDVLLPVRRNRCDRCVATEPRSHLWHSSWLSTNRSH